MLSAVEQILAHLEGSINMPIGTLTFNLPEERDDFQMAQHGWKFSAAIWDLDQESLRPITKHGVIPDELMAQIVEIPVPPTKVHTEEMLQKYTIDVIEWVRSKLYMELNERNLEVP